MVRNGGNTLKALVITHPKIDNLQVPANDEPKYNFLYFVFQTKIQWLTEDN